MYIGHCGCGRLIDRGDRLCDTCFEKAFGRKNLGNWGYGQQAGKKIKIKK